MWFPFNTAQKSLSKWWWFIKIRQSFAPHRHLPLQSKPPSYQPAISMSRSSLDEPNDARRCSILRGECRAAYWNMIWNKLTTWKTCIRMSIKQSVSIYRTRERGTNKRKTSLKLSAYLGITISKCPCTVRFPKIV